MQIDPAALTGTDSASTSIPAAKPVPQVPPVTQKATRALISVPRLDFEPIYTELKAAVGDNWVEYKQATALFLLGVYCIITTEVPLSTFAPWGGLFYR